MQLMQDGVSLAADRHSFANCPSAALSEKSFSKNCCLLLVYDKMISLGRMMPSADVVSALPRLTATDACRLVVHGALIAGGVAAAAYAGATPSSSLDVLGISAIVAVSLLRRKGSSIAVLRVLLQMLHAVVVIACMRQSFSLGLRYGVLVLAVLFTCPPSRVGEDALAGSGARVPAITSAEVLALALADPHWTAQVPEGAGVAGPSAPASSPKSGGAAAAASGKPQSCALVTFHTGAGDDVLQVPDEASARYSKAAPAMAGGAPAGVHIVPASYWRCDVSRWKDVPSTVPLDSGLMSLETPAVFAFAPQSGAGAASAVSSASSGSNTAIAGSDAADGDAASGLSKRKAKAAAAAAASAAPPASATGKDGKPLDTVAAAAAAIVRRLPYVDAAGTVNTGTLLSTRALVNNFGLRK